MKISKILSQVRYPMKLRHLSAKLLTEHHEDIPEDSTSSSMIYETLKVLTSYGSITFLATHLPPLILNYCIDGIVPDFTPSQVNEAQAKIEEAKQDVKMGYGIGSRCKM
jgi:hypothetical protein